MELSHWVMWPLMFSVSCLAALAALWLAGRLMTRSDTGRAKPVILHGKPSTFLFHNGDLVDHDVNDLIFDHPVIADLQCWRDLRLWLGAHGQVMPDTPDALPDGKDVQHALGRSYLTLRRDGDDTLVTLGIEVPPSGAAWHQVMTLAQEAADGLSALTHAPDPIWRRDANGTVTWANTACTRLRSDDGQLPNADDLESGRFEVTQDGATAHYQLNTQTQGDQTLCFARDITAQVQAESSQREFVQTFTKTFANLTTGLAIFDKSQQLALFNPALTDLTGAPIALLSARPHLMDFFDSLREAQVMPEPKNYADWRSQIRDVVARANDGLYQETWALPTGLTYRVTGRPHPDGAVAFLFEDISAELSITRRFRTQIDLHQSVLDQLDEAIAILSDDKVLFCNAPCRNLLQMDPDSSFGDMGLPELVEVLGTRFAPTGNWSALSASILERSSSAPDLRVPMVGGREMDCTLRDLGGGIRMLSLRGQTKPAQIESVA